MPISTDELVAMRRIMSQQTYDALRPVDFTKAQFAAAIQACVDRLDATATRTAISAGIETAVPGKFDAADKTLIFVLATLHVARREGVL